MRRRSICSLLGCDGVCLAHLLTSRAEESTHQVDGQQPAERQGGGGENQREAGGDRSCVDLVDQWGDDGGHASSSRARKWAGTIAARAPTIAHSTDTISVSFAAVSARSSSDR